MLRVFLVIEDANQMNPLKAILTRVGCVVETLGVEVGLKNRIMAFRPDVLITSGTGKKVNPLTITPKVREASKDCKILLILGKGMKISLSDLAENRYDAFVEIPLDPLRVLTTLNQFAKNKNYNIDLVEKYQKILSSGMGQIIDGKNPSFISSSLSKSQEQLPFDSKFNTSLDNATRIKAYEELTKDIQFNPKSFISKSGAREKQAELQKQWDRKIFELLDEEKRRFVKALFNKD